MRSFLTMATVLVSSYVFGQLDSTLMDQSIQEVRIVVKESKKNELKSTELQQLTDRFLADLPQITLIRRGNFAQEPTLRGLNAGQINLTFDGMQIFGACTDRMDPISSYLEPNNLKSVRLFTTPNGEDMAGSTGGGIDFKLRSAEFSEKAKWHGNTGLGFESNGLASQFLMGLEFSSKRIAFNANGTYRKSNNYVDGNGTEIRYSQYEKWNASIGLKAKLSKNQRLELLYMQDEGYNIGYPALTMDVSFAKAKIASIAHVYHSHNKALRHWESKFYWNFIDHAMDDTKRAPEEVPMHMDMPGTSRTFGFYTKGKVKIRAKHQIQFTASSFMNDLHAEMTMYPDFGAEMFMLTIPDTRRIQSGLNLGYKTRLSENLFLNASLRSDYVSSFITTEMGRNTLTSVTDKDPDRNIITYNANARLDYRRSRSLSTGLSVAHAMRPPTVQELYGFYLFNRADNFDFLGNSELISERSLNVEWNLNFRNKHFVTEVRAFTYLFDDYIAGLILDEFSQMTIGASGVKQYSNIGKAIISGFETSIRYEINDQFAMNTVNSFTYGRDQENNALPFIPPFKSTNSVTYSWRQFNTDAEVVLASDQPHVSTQRYGELASKGYAILNLGVGYSVKIKDANLDFSLKAENILDRAYYDHLNLMKVNSPGRNLILRVGYSF